MILLLGIELNDNHENYCEELIALTCRSKGS